MVAVELTSSAEFYHGRRWKMALAACLLLISTVAGAQEPQRFEVTIAERHVVEGGPVIRVTLGDQVEVIWTSDEDGDLHVHGYDLEIKLDDAGPTVTSFEAFAAGRFPITSHGFAGGDGHDDHGALLYLEVYPD